MASRIERHEDNIEGQWYVDKKCILCSVCSETAPQNFRESTAGGYDIVYKQPTGDEEVSQCEEAMAACPVEAIGNDSL